MLQNSARGSLHEEVTMGSWYRSTVIEWCEKVNATRYKGKEFIKWKREKLTLLEIEGELPDCETVIKINKHLNCSGTITIYSFPIQWNSISRESMRADCTRTWHTHFGQISTKYQKLMNDLSKLKLFHSPWDLLKSVKRAWQTEVERG